MKREWRVLAASLIAYTAWAAVRIREPLVGHRESAAVQYGKHAQSFLWHGGKTRGILLDTSGPDLSRYEQYQDYFYPDHPPLPGLILAALFAGLGPHDWVIRLQAHLFALGCVALLFLLARKWFDSATAMVAAPLLTALPMFAYFAGSSFHQAPTLFFILAGLLAYAHGRTALVFVFQFLACYTDWPGYYLGVVLFLHAAIVERKWRALLHPAANLAIFGLYVLHVYAADPGALRQLWKALTTHSSRPPFFAYLLGEGRELATYFGIAGLAAVGWLLRRVRSPGNAWIFCLPALALDELWLPSYCHLHDYCSFFLAPFVALAAARFCRGKAIVAVVGSLLLLQCAVVLHRRVTTPVHYEHFRRVGVAIREAAPPEDRVLVLTLYGPLVTPHYSRRHADVYDVPTGLLFSDRMGPARKTTLDEVLARRYDWIVVAERDRAVAGSRFFETLRRSMPPDEFDRRMADFRIELPGSPLLRRLEAMAESRVEREGITLFRLPRPPR